MQRLALLVMCLASLAVFPGWQCGPPLINDPGFDIWCGQKLCAWSVDAGEVLRVPTWHRSDYGAELVGEQVVLSQVTDRYVDCFHFELQADMDDGVALFIEMDFLDDGSKEYSHPLSSDDWQPVGYHITPPVWYSSVRFIIRKEGAGRAVLTRIRVGESSGCTEPPIGLSDLPDGARCNTADDCLSELCVEIVQQPGTSILGGESTKNEMCSRCRSSDDCPQDMVCGLDETEDPLYVYQACGLAGRRDLGERCREDMECASPLFCSSVIHWPPEGEDSAIQTCGVCRTTSDCPSEQVCGMEKEDTGYRYYGCDSAGRHDLGERCLGHLECSSGRCCDGICSQCCEHADCATGDPCKQRDWQELGGDEYMYLLLPWQCSPGEGKGLPRAPCLRDEDCLSNICQGTVEAKQCVADASPCQEDADCIFMCLPLGVAGGECQ